MRCEVCGNSERMNKGLGHVFAYSVDVRFRDGHELDEGDMKKAEMYLKRVFRDDNDLNQISVIFYQYLLKRNMFDCM